MILIKSIFISVLCLIGISLFVKKSIEQNLNYKNESYNQIINLETQSDNQIVFSDKNLTIKKVYNQNLNYLDILVDKGDLELMPDFIPIGDENAININFNSKFLNLQNSNLKFFMLLDSKIFRLSSNMFTNNLAYLILLLFILLFSFKFIFFLINFFKFSTLTSLISLSIFILFASQYIDAMNNFKVLGIRSKVVDNLDSTLVRNSILVIPDDKLNYSLILKSKIDNIPSISNNVLLFNYVAGPENFIYINQNKLFAQQTLVNNNNIPLPYKQEINSIYNPEKSTSSNLEFEIINSKFVTLKLDSDLGGKRGFYFPVLRNHIVFPKSDQRYVSQTDYDLSIYTQLRSINFLKNTLLLLFIVLFFPILRLVKNER